MDIGADHHLCDRGCGFIARDAGANDLAVAQDGGAFAQRPYFFELVGNIEDSLSLVAQRAQHGKKVVDLLGREDRGRLVHDDEVGMAQKAAHDLDALALADRKVVHIGVRFERQPVFLRDLFDVGCHFFDGRVAGQGDGNVFGNRERFKKGKVLEHHAHAKLAGEGGTGNGNGLAPPDDLARVGLQRAIEHFDEGGFPGSVFTQKSMDFTRKYLQINGVVGLETPEGFGETSEGQQWF